MFGALVGRMYAFFVMSPFRGEQDACIFMCPGAAGDQDAYIFTVSPWAGCMHFLFSDAPGEQDACIFMCSGVPGEQDVCIFTVSPFRDRMYAFLRAPTCWGA